MQVHPAVATDLNISERRSQREKRSTKNAPPTQRPASNGNARMPDNARAEFPDRRLLNRWPPAKRRRRPHAMALQSDVKPRHIGFRRRDYGHRHRLGSPSVAPPTSTWLKRGRPCRTMESARRTQWPDGRSISASYARRRSGHRPQRDERPRDQVMIISTSKLSVPFQSMSSRGKFREVTPPA